MLLDTFLLPLLLRCFPLCSTFSRWPAVFQPHRLHLFQRSLVGALACLFHLYPATAVLVLAMTLGGLLWVLGLSCCAFARRG